MMAISFNRYGRLYYLDPGPHSPKVGDKVLFPTTAGDEVAECVWAPTYVSEDVAGLPVCAGFASSEQLTRDERNRERRAQARVSAKRLVRAHDLPMKVVGVDYLDADNSFIIYFSAPHRVDFRALVRDLAKALNARIELRQLGARDEARVQGGVGPCGRDTCCSTFLKDFEPVSVRMAKDQDLPPNPLKISGACGRLMCCLKYEHPLYNDFKADLPKIAHALRPLRLDFGLGESRKQHCRENRDDRNDHQQFDQGKTAAPKLLRGELHRLKGTRRPTRRRVRAA